MLSSGIVQLLPEILDTLKTCPGNSKGSIFDDCLLKNFDLMKSTMENVIDTLRKSVTRDLIQVVIHCDYHPGNLKFIDNEVTALFDFDWSKLDIRIFDVALAIFYFFTEWEGELDGSLRLLEVEKFLSAYQQTLQNSNKLKPLNEQECGLLPIMIEASNIYVLNWTILDFYNKNLSAQDYLVFLEHGINMIKWLKVEENQARLVQCNPQDLTSLTGNRTIGI